jgi:hypothetical protein
VALPSPPPLWHLRRVLSELCLVFRGVLCKLHLMSRGAVTQTRVVLSCMRLVSADPKPSCKIIHVVRYRIHITKLCKYIMKYLWHWSSLLTRVLCHNVAQQLTPSAPARRTPSKKGLILAWAGHLPHPTKETLHGLSDPLTLAFRHPVSKNKWLVQYYQRIYEIREVMHKSNTYR